MAEKILVADESPTVRNVAESLLKKHGYTVLLADNGARALTLAETDGPELIFLDDAMSIPGGEGAWSVLRQKSGAKDIPVVMLLTGDRKDRQQELIEKGAEGFISKPFNPREILDHAERLVRKKETAPSEGLEGGKGPTPAEERAADKEESGKDVPPADERKPDGELNILETSDVMEDLGPGGAGTDEEPAHGFDWFLYELKKETRKPEESVSRVEEKPGLSGDESSEEKVELQEESEAYELDEEGRNFEDFVRDLKQEVEHPYEREVVKGRPSAARVIERPQLDQLISYLKERIPAKIAQEVGKRISPEFLEKIIREEIAKIEKVIS
ncbi:MAG: response regulator [Candidatus Zixiibacteriota bacterium]|nr:MAG: response regulator [candidate division Zixibacteria bacterium]